MKNIVINENVKMIANFSKLEIIRHRKLFPLVVTTPINVDLGFKKVIYLDLF